MEIIIESPHFTIDKRLQDYTIKKVGKLAHFDERLLKSEVLLKFEKSGHDDNKVCEIKVKPIMQTYSLPVKIAHLKKLSYSLFMPLKSS